MSKRKQVHKSPRKDCDSIVTLTLDAMERMQYRTFSRRTTYSGAAGYSCEGFDLGAGRLHCVVGFHSEIRAVSIGS